MYEFTTGQEKFISFRRWELGHHHHLPHVAGCHHPGDGSYEAYRRWYGQFLRNNPEIDLLWSQWIRQARGGRGQDVEVFEWWIGAEKSMRGDSWPSNYPEGGQWLEYESKAICRIKGGRPQHTTMVMIRDSPDGSYRKYRWIGEEWVDAGPSAPPAPGHFRFTG